MLFLLQSSGAVPRFHGNGFAQLPLPSGRRLHVWHPSLQPIQGHNATIHNHVWDMQSRVLVGCLTHRSLEVEHEEIEPTHDVWGSGECAPDRMVSTATVRVTGEYHMTAGSIYVFPQGEYHESESAEITATLMEKRAVSRFRNAYHRTNTARPMIICPHGEQPVDAFAVEHQPSEFDMWAAIGDALDIMSPATVRELRECVL